jgi:hypothetical protein
MSNVVAPKKTAPLMERNKTIIEIKTLNKKKKKITPPEAETEIESKMLFLISVLFDVLFTYNPPPELTDDID